jgi:PP-loop superfamily ATP-utilizing enzyme
VVTGTFITQNLVEKIESAEELLTDLQMENTKLRVKGNRAYLEVSEEERLDVEGQWTKIKGFLQNIGFHYLYLRIKI